MLYRIVNPTSDAFLEVTHKNDAADEETAHARELARVVFERILVVLVRDAQARVLLAADDAVPYDDLVVHLRMRRRALSTCVRATWRNGRTPWKFV